MLTVIKNRKTWINAFICMIITGILAVVIFSICGRMIGGKYTFIHSDCMQQYVPAIKMFWRNILHGKSLLYSFEFSMGQETLPLYVFYGCFSPVNIAYALISDVNIATMVVVVVRLMFASFAFYIFADYVSKNGKYKCDSIIFKSILSVSYGLSAYFLIFYFNILYLDGSYMLPVIMLLIFKLINEGKFIWLIPAYGYIFIASFYSGYIIGIFSLVTLLTFSIADYGKDVKRVLSNIFKLGVSAIVGFLISACVIYPTIVYVLNNSGASRNQFRGLNITIVDIIGNMFMGQMQSVDGLYPNSYCGLLSLILVIVFFATKKVTIKEKIKYGILLSFLILCSLIDFLYLGMHIFNAPDSFGFRFAYLYSFVLLMIALNSYSYIKECSQIILVIIGAALYGVYYLSHILQLKKLSPRFVSSDDFMLKANAVFLILYILFLIKIKDIPRKIFATTICLIVCVEVIINGFAVVSRVAKVPPDVKEAYAAKENEAIKAVNQIKSLSSEQFYRVYYDNVINNNYSQLYNYKSIGSTSSIENVALHDTLHKLGYMTMPAMVIDYGGTPVTRMIFGQGYVINGYNPGAGEEEIRNPLVYDNEYALSIGYMATEDVIDLSFDGDNIFTNQNRLIASLTGEKNMIWNSEGISMFNEAHNTDLLSSDSKELLEYGKFYITTVDGREGSFVILVNSDKEELYGYVETNESLDQSGTSPYLYSENGDTGSWMSSATANTPHATKLGRRSNGEYNLRFYFDETTDDFVFFNSIDVAYIDNAVFEDTYNKLSKNQFEVKSFNNTEIKGVVKATDERDVLFTTIPYSSNWKAYVDGIETETYAACNDSFVAVKLSSGEHSIEFKYRDSSVMIGMIMSAAGIVILAGMIVFSRKKQVNPI